MTQREKDYLPLVPKKKKDKYVKEYPYKINYMQILSETLLMTTDLVKIKLKVNER